jgi:ABC-2 type transport system ATP-binding protein
MTLEARALTKAYRNVVALHELSFAAAAGEVIGLLGPNGAGKTTAIRALTTILAPSAGRFAVAGIPHTRPTEIRRRIGVLPESAGYPDRQTGAEFLRYHARLYGHSVPSARSTAAALLAEVGLAERRDSLIAGYSRGMRQRLGIARALLNEPAVVFLDEPTLGLDPQSRNQLWTHVKHLNETEGVTVFLTTHYMDEAERVAHRIAIIDHGKIVSVGTAQELKEKTGADSLEGAFLKLTGSTIRDERADGADQMRQMVRMWRR